MRHIQEALSASFPWLERAEIEEVAVQLHTGGAGSGIERMRAVAKTLDQLGLPPTSSLLLSIVGRGSKGAAVQVARETARTRFERAALSPQPLEPAASSIDESNLRAILFEAVSQLRGQVANASTAETELVQMVRSISGELNWLKSTIDTERQLRKQLELHGTQVGETKKSPSTSRAQERRAIVADLARSLETDRFGANYRGPDPADGAQE